MISLQNDYSEGTHPQILKRLAEINLEQNPGYCTDSYCASAAEKIRQACECPEADIFFSRRNPDQPGRYRYHAGAL